MTFTIMIGKPSTSCERWRATAQPLLTWRFVQAREREDAPKFHIIARFRDAFGLGLIEVLPIVEFLKPGKREGADAEQILDPVSSAIQENRSDWDRPDRTTIPPTATPCPYCNAPLRTSAAKQCFECGMDWRDAAKRS